MEPDSSMDRRSSEARERLLLVEEHDIVDIEMSSGRECPGSERGLEEKKGIWYLIALTAGLGGLQCVFTVQFSYGSPYLSSIGLSKPLMCLVWLAGPLAGAFAQPFFGAWSDQSSSRWGRRRPFILLGGVLTIISLLGLAWSQAIGESLSRTPHSSRGGAPTATKAVAIFFVYLLNLGTQPIQGGLRSLIIEKAARHQQMEASAWASRLVEAGNLFSYIIGCIALPGFLPFLGETQFQALCSLVSCVLAVSLATTCWFITETVPEQNATFKSRHCICNSPKYYAFKLPTISNQIKIMLQVQFASWMSWFPFLYYTTTYFNQIYNTRFLNMGSEASTSPDWINGTKAGSLAFILYSMISLGAGSLLPSIVQSSQENKLVFQSDKTFQLLAQAQLARLTMRRLWILSLFLFACCLFAMPLASSLIVCTSTIALAGICRAVTAWVPFALLGHEIAYSIEQGSWDEPRDESLKSTTGSLVGIHNLAMALPQVIATFEAAIIFWVLGSQDLTEDVVVGWVIRAGCLPAVGAALFAMKLREDIDRF